MPIRSRSNVVLHFDLNDGLFLPTCLQRSWAGRLSNHLRTRNVKRFPAGWHMLMGKQESSESSSRQGSQAPKGSLSHFDAPI
jgi:hypothetical protein